jgi:hypothetical protein
MKAELMAHFLCTVSFGKERRKISGILGHTSSRSLHRGLQGLELIGVPPVYLLLTAMLDHPC